MKNIISKSVFILLLFLVLAGSKTVQGQRMYPIVYDPNVQTGDYYVLSWIVFSVSPYTTYPCDHYFTTAPCPIPSGWYHDFFANVNDTRDPIYKVYVRIIRYNQFDVQQARDENTTGFMTTTELQGSWYINLSPQ